MSVKMKDIAQYLSLSKSTVSLALSNAPGNTISEETRRRVVQAARDLGYKGYQFNRQLAFVLYHRQLDNPRYSEMLTGIEKLLRQHHFNVLYMSLNSPSELTEFTRFVQRGEVSGLLVTGAIDELITDVVMSSGIPHLFIGGMEHEGLNVITDDYYLGAYEATRYLLSLGHRKIAFLSGKLNVIGHKLGLEGYQAALQEAGVELDKTRIQISNGEDGYELCERMEALDIEYTAAFCVNTVIQFGVLQRLRECGIRVPGAISLIGYGMTSLARTSKPPLTTVNWDTGFIEAIVARIMHCISNRTAPSEQIVHPYVAVIEGGTCAPHIDQ